MAAEACWEGGEVLGSGSRRDGSVRCDRVGEVFPEPGLAGVAHVKGVSLLSAFGQAWACAGR